MPSKNKNITSTDVDHTDAEATLRTALLDGIARSAVFLRLSPAQADKLLDNLVRSVLGPDLRWALKVLSDPYSTYCPLEDPGIHECSAPRDEEDVRAMQDEAEMVRACEEQKRRTGRCCLEEGRNCRGQPLSSGP